MVPDDELDARIAQLAARMAALGSEAVRRQKRLLNEWIDMTRARAIEDGIAQFRLAFLTGEPQHYMTRFTERQAARSQLSSRLPQGAVGGDHDALRSPSSH